jgi:putative acetyltransferase
MTQIRFGGLARTRTSQRRRAPQPRFVRVSLSAVAYSIAVSDIQVRAAEPSDAEAIFDIFSGRRAVSGTLQIPWVSLEERRARLVRDPNRHSLVATIDSRVVGMAGLHLEPSPRRRDCGSIGMAVHDDFHGRGVGGALICALIDLSDNWYGLRRVELTVYTDNAAAVHLYEKFGFVIEGIGKSYALRNGEYVDAYYMARLRPSSAST